VPLPGLVRSDLGGHCYKPLVIAGDVALQKRNDVA
jgi:hypothetical protein